MATPSAEWFTVQPALVAALQATAGYGAPGTDGKIQVYPGPLPTSDVVYKYVLIGSDGTDSGSAGMFKSDWLAMGARADRAETGEIHCYVCSWDGAFDNWSSKLTDVQSMLADLQTAAYGIAEASEAAYRALTDADEIQQLQTDAGLIVAARVVVRYELTRA